MDYDYRAAGSWAVSPREHRFRVWAPHADKLELVLLPGREMAAGARQVRMAPVGGAYFEALVSDVLPGMRYRYRFSSGKELPDPASVHQPDGVNGPSAVCDLSHDWRTETWSGIELKDAVFYELHTGTFSEAGTFEGVIPHLEYLRSFGITVVEIMPVAQFPGARNWGYDGAYPFAVQHSYGGPRGLKKLVDACHVQGLAVALDVVYNHLGPEGNYLGEFGPYFTDRYKTPWGQAVNYDGEHSDEVRAYFIRNALYWLEEYRIDMLRLDALHAIYDFSAYPFLSELADVVHRAAARLNRRIYLVGESDLNDPRLILPHERGGMNLDAQWSDDFHHALHALMTGERSGYYEDFGAADHVRKAFAEGYVYSGDYSPHRKRRHGACAADLDGAKFVVFSQNHDQVGNRCRGDRLCSLVSFEQQKLGAAMVILSPYLPLFFMGEEYGETAPFQYFVDHESTSLLEDVQRGRTAEFSSFMSGNDVPDPGAASTFAASKLNHELRQAGRHRLLLEWYSGLLRLRQELPPLAAFARAEQHFAALDNSPGLVMRRRRGQSEVAALFNLSGGSLEFPLGAERWRKLLDSAERRWGGKGSAVSEQPAEGSAAVLASWSVVLFEKR